jgi:hypothetical protein
LPDPEAGDQSPGSGPPENQEGLLHRVVRSVIAPDVLEDGGHDAPMSPRGRLLFYAVVGALVLGIVVLLLVTANSR